LRVGLIARSEHRGLGVQSWEFYRHVQPFKVLLVDMARDAGYETHPDWFPGATVVPYQTELDLNTCRKRIQDLDVVYSAETFYDWRVCDWAREMGVRTVCHLMPEYFRHGIDRGLTHPDVWWTPTSWRRAMLPSSIRLVPVPIALERFTDRSSHMHSPLKWLHVAGVVASGDRNGSMVVRQALPLLKREHVVRIRTLTSIPRPSAGERTYVELIVRPAKEYWQLYDDADALLSPRRYAGLSLPAMEAMAAGLALVMTDCEPQQSEWPILPLPAAVSGSVQIAGGSIPLANVAPEVLAARMDWLADHPDEIAAGKRRARAFAERMSWERLAPQIRIELERACQ
jgi:hypothetical protein